MLGLNQRCRHLSLDLLLLLSSPSPVFGLFLEDLAALTRQFLGDAGMVWQASEVILKM